MAFAHELADVQLAARGGFAGARITEMLDLKVPAQADIDPAHGGLLGALAARWPSYVAYLAAFLTIGIIWLNHRTLVDRIARFDARLHWLNLLLLLGVATLPFPTSLVAEYVQHGGPDASVATALYGLCAMIMALPWGFIWRHLADRPDLLEAGYDAAYARAEWVRGSIGVPIYATATVVALFAPIISLLLYLSIAVIYGTTSQGVKVRTTPSDQPA